MRKVFARSLNNLAKPNDFAGQVIAMQPLKRSGPTKTRPSMDEQDIFLPGGSSKNLYHDVWRKIASSMMDISLFLSNANQLANVLRKPNFENTWEVYEIISLVLICSSITLQIVVGIVMIMTRRKLSPRPSEKYEESNRFTSLCIFLIFVMNVLILGINNEPSHYRCPQLGWGSRNETHNATHNDTTDLETDVD